MPDCSFPGCYRTALYADWCHRHLPQTQRNAVRQQRNTSTAAVEPNLFDMPAVPAPDGLDLKRGGQAIAVAPNALEDWKRRFKTSLAKWAATGHSFTSEDVIAIVGLPCGDIAMNANNAVGAMMTAAAKAGLIRKTGNRVQARRASSHGAELTEWIGAAR